MSCIRFSTAAQRAAMRGDAVAVTGEEAAVLHLSPPITESKLLRLRLLARHERPGIRRSVAASRSAPADLLEQLARDPDASVRGEVAKNENSPAPLVTRLAADPDARVRCWAALNPVLPAGLVRALAADPDAQVARLAGWRLGVTAHA